MKNPRRTTHATAAWLSIVLGTTASIAVLGDFSLVAKAVLLGVELALALIVLAAYAIGMAARDDAAGPKDPWDHQRELMAASGQRLPSVPMMQNGVLLYAALSMEELGETLEVLAKALRLPQAAECTRLPEARAARLAVALSLKGQADNLQQEAKMLRLDLQRFGIEFFMPGGLACELLDGTTDLAVTNCGLALSAGLPGAAGYAEVVGSNLSKRDPATGRIEKTPDGKWIKGPDYRAPDLRAVLAAA